MLFNYRYVPHTIETLQRWLDHLVKTVWCNPVADYSLELLDPELREIVQAIFNDDSITNDYLDGPIRRIYELFKTRLTGAQRLQVATWYDNNNDIAALCACDPNKPPATYPQIKTLNVDLEKELKNFCKSLWSDVLDLAVVKNRIGDIDQHYDDFVIENNEGKCPYCGYGDIKGMHHTRREAYDHYLPKGTYLFNSVNFRNLAPMCNECNSSYKLAKNPLRHLDPLHKTNAGTRRKAFYSYAAAPSDISINLRFATGDIAKMRPSDISLDITSPGRKEEIDGWKDVFGIDERYKAKCLGKNDGRAWLGRVTEENENYNLTPQQMLEAEIRAAENKPWSDTNFLKKPFLLACEDAGLIH